MAFVALSRVAIAEPATQRPNILFIMTDQQHAAMISCTGNAHVNTPAMDSLARDGIRFERAYVANPVCVPSRISIATGVMPGRLGVFSNGMKAIVPDHVNENSLGRLIQRAGYDTFYGGKVHMCRELNPPNAGYDVVDRDQREALPAACIKFIRRKHDRPFFAAASFINPHDICFAHAAHIGKAPNGMRHVEQLYRQASALPLDQLPPLPANYAIPVDEPEAIESHLSPKAVTPAGTMRRDYDERQWRIYRWIYCRLTEQVDEHIGRILDAVDDAGLEETTLILFTSDHGNMDASHQLASKGLFYEESVRVPFLLKYKGVIPAGQVNDKHLVATGLDILPTLCDYADADVPGTLLGRSLRAIAEGQSVDDWRTYVVSENSWGRMIRSERIKYCIYDSGAVPESLVDLAKDPGECSNLAARQAYQDSLIEHRRYLQQWIEESTDTEAEAFMLGVTRPADR
ncbi:MAG: sulfatase family protein [Planctomycetota bacterium]